MQSQELQRSTQDYRIDDDHNGLIQFLQIKPPEAADTSPAILSFARKREVPVPWGNILHRLAVTGSSNVAAVRSYFESSWPFDSVEDVLKADPERLIGGNSPVIREIVKDPNDPKKASPEIYRTSFDPQGKPTEQLVDRGIVIHHATTDRWYLMIPKPGEGPNFRKERFIGDLYQTAWEKIAGVELVFTKPGDAAQHFTDFEDLDMRPALIERRYQELKIVKSYASSVKGSVDSVTTKMVKDIVDSGMDADEIEDLQKRTLRLAMGEYDAQRQLERLATQAAGLGFRLPLTKGQTVKIPGKDDKTLEAGKLYRPFRRIARWSTKHTRKEVDWGLVAGLSILSPGLGLLALANPRTVSYASRHEKEITDYTEVDTTKDLLSDKREQLISQGLQVFVFEQTPDGFATADGMPLLSVMQRCKVDEEFRRHCAVLLPVYEESLTGDRLVAKYSIFKRPLPGLLPSILPRLSLEESLSYRSAWLQTQLGELVSSLNLAPGEERKVTISKRFERETTVTRSSTSIFDITQSESTDLASEMENQVQQERESSSNLEFSTTASGDFGDSFSAEATASGGTNSSLKDVSQAISKVAKKAAQSVSRQNKEEVTSTSSSKTNVASTDETVATIRNINQGRSLNLMFYRLYNKYTGGLYLEGLRFHVIPSVELIAGSGVYDSRSYTLEDLPNMLQEFSPERLPFGIKEEQHGEYLDNVLKSIKDLLVAEYATQTEFVKPDGADDAAKTRSVEPDHAADLTVQRIRFEYNAPSAESEADRGASDGHMARIKQLADALRRITFFSNKPMVPQELLVAAPGLYLDSLVGAQASTEPYSERMRTQEVNMRNAEVKLKESEALYQRAMAMRLADIPNGENGNQFVGVDPDFANSTLRLRLKYPLSSERDWHLYFGTTDNGTPNDVDGASLLFAWDDPQQWLKADDLLLRLRLFHKRLGTIRYPIWPPPETEHANVSPSEPTVWS